MTTSKPFLSLDSRNSLDRGLVVVSTKRWWILLALMVTSVAAIVWSLVAEVPIIVEGPGILLHDTGVSQVECLVAGELEDIRVERGVAVRKGDILAVIRSPSTVAEIESSRTKLQSMIQVHEKAVENEELQRLREMQIVESRSDTIRGAIQGLESIISKWNDAESNEDASDQQPILAEVERDAESLLKKLRSQSQTLSTLASDNLVTVSDVNKSENAALAALQALLQWKDQQTYKKRQSLQFRQGLMELQSKLQDWQHTLQSIELQWSKTLGQLQVERFRREIEIETQKSNVSRLSEEYERYRILRAHDDGVVLEIPHSLGDPIQPGQSIASLARTPSNASIGDLKVTAFFPLTSGKKIQPLAAALVSPSVAESHRYGSIRGTVKDVYGYPMSSSEAYRLVGNREVLAPILHQGGVLGIHVLLNRTNDGSGSGLDWTIRGTPPDLTLGTIVKVRVVVERRPPISYLLPMIRRTVLGPDRIEDVLP